MIEVLQGPDRVRKRPNIFFEDWKNALRELLLVFAREAMLGYGKCLHVNQDGAVLEVWGEDRGIDLSGDAWERVFCQLFPAPAYRPDESGYCLSLFDDQHYTLYGEELPPNGTYFLGEFCCMELYALQCVCKFMEIRVVRDGHQSILRFEKGHNKGGIRREKTDLPSGSRFRFEPDPEVFSTTVIPEEWILNALEEIALQVPGLACSYKNATGTDTQVCYPNGICDYIKSEIPVYGKVLEARGRNRYDRAEYQARIHIAVGFTPNAGQMRCFHNFKELPYGGTHLEELKEQLRNSLNCCLGTGEGEKHFSAVILSWCPSHCSMWENGSRQAIKNVLIRDMTHDALGQEFENYLHRHREALTKGLLP